MMGYNHIVIRPGQLMWVRRMAVYIPGADHMLCRRSARMVLL